MSDIILLGQNFLALFVESAPWLLLGLLVAGIMHNWYPFRFWKSAWAAHRLLNYKGAVIGAFTSAFAALSAALCLDVAVHLNLHYSFLVSTPETGVTAFRCPTHCGPLLHC